MALTHIVRVWTRAETGTDPMGDPIYDWSHVDVPGALVRNGSGSDLEVGDSASAVRPDGIRVLYTIAFPKTYDGPCLRHARVTLLDPEYGMDTDEATGWETALAVSGDPRPQLPCPTKWNLIAEVGRTDG